MNAPPVRSRALLDRAFGLLSTHRRTLRKLFLLYALLTATLTHWPQLTLPPVVKDPDLIAHLCVFSLWTFAAGLCGFFGPALSRDNIAWTALVAAVYTAIDEGTQAIPIIRRTVALDDYMANLSGVCLGFIALGVLSQIHVRVRDRSAHPV